MGTFKDRCEIFMSASASTVNLILVSKLEPPAAAFFVANSQNLQDHLGDRAGARVGPNTPGSDSE